MQVDMAMPHRFEDLSEAETVRGFRKKSLSQNIQRTEKPEKRYLKVLSSKTDLADSRFVRKVVIKERGAEVFRKIYPSPIAWEPFKDSAHLVQLLAIRSKLPTAHTALSLPIAQWTFNTQNVVFLSWQGRNERPAILATAWCQYTIVMNFHGLVGN